MTDNTTNYLISNTEITVTKDIGDLSRSATQLWKLIKDKTNKKITEPYVKIYTDKYNVPIIEFEWVRDYYYLSLRLLESTEHLLVYYSDTDTTLNEVHELDGKLPDWLVQKLLVFINKNNKQNNGH